MNFSKLISVDIIVSKKYDNSDFVVIETECFKPKEIEFSVSKDFRDSKIIFVLKDVIHILEQLAYVYIPFVKTQGNNINSELRNVDLNNIKIDIHTLTEQVDKNGNDYIVLTEIKDVEFNPKIQREMSISKNFDIKLTDTIEFKFKETTEIFVK